ncbi:MAG: caspase family protein [Candidatus Aminicenantes bacterium]|nr:caspase family protein [Candidatus Aminicenantes bacterium]
MMGINHFSKTILFYMMMVMVGSGVLSAQQRGIELLIKDKSGKKVGFYQKSHALIIGVSDYTGGWPDIESIPDEIKKLKRSLSDHGFKLQIIMDPDSKKLFQAYTLFINQHGYNPDNRLLFFFCGHGYSRQAGKKGYLVPADAPDPRKDEIGFLRKALNMTQILTWSRQIESRHALFLFDSCFSGTIFKTRALPSQPPHITDLTSRPIRQFITAGSAGEEVPARSVFTPSFIRGINGQADLNKDGYVTGTELGIFLHDTVVNYRKGQTPQYGKIKDPDLDEGDFVFQIPKQVSSPNPPQARTVNDPELDCWMLVKNSDEISDVQYYLNNYPRGKFIIPARLKLKQIQRRQQVPRADKVRKPTRKTNAEWKNDKGDYWIYVDGKSYGANTKSEWIDNNLLVYVEALKQYYVMKDYKHRDDNTLRPAQPVTTPNQTLWRNENGLFWLYVNGKSCNNIKSDWTGDDVLAFVPSLQRYYLLEDYRHRNDNTLRPAHPLESPNQTLWSNEKGKYWLFVQGVARHKDSLSEWIDNSLLVYVPALEQYYLMRDYKQYGDRVFRPAESLYSPNGTLWRNQNGNFWIYANGKSYGSSTRWVWIDQHILVYVPELQHYYQLENYKTRADNKLRPALPLVSGNGTLWRRKDNLYWLYVKGKPIHTESTSSWQGNDLLVSVSSLNQQFVLQNYKNRDDNTLRPALIKR